MLKVLNNYFRGVLLGEGVVGNSVGALKFAAVIVTNAIYETILMVISKYSNKVLASPF